MAALWQKYAIIDITSLLDFDLYKKVGQGKVREV